MKLQTFFALVSVLAPAWAAPLVSPLATPQALSPGAAADAHNPGLNADGRFVVFVSAADNLVTNDNNGALDVFVRDRQLGRTLLVSVNPAGTRSGNGASHSPAISANGQFVVFESSAGDLVTNDNNNAADVFVRDLQTATNLAASGNRAGSGLGNGHSQNASLDATGRYVAFQSASSNLTANDTNGVSDVFLRDLVLERTILLSINRDGTGTGNALSGSPVMSADGSTV